MGGNAKGSSATPSSASTGKVYHGVENLIGDLLSTDPAKKATGVSMMTLDPTVFNKIGTTLEDTAFGGYLDVANNPTSKALADSIKQQSMQMLNQSNAGLKSQFAQSGQNNSGALMQAQTQGGIQANANATSTLANQLFNLYNSERNRQMSALSGLTSYEETPATLTGTLGGLTGQGSTPATQGWLNQIVSGIGSLVGMGGGKSTTTGGTSGLGMGSGGGSGSDAGGYSYGQG